MNVAGISFELVVGWKVEFQFSFPVWKIIKTKGWKMAARKWMNNDKMRQQKNEP